MTEIPLLAAAISILGLILACLKAFLSHQVLTRKSRIESTSLLSSLMDRNVSGMSGKELLITEEIFSAHYQKPIYSKHLNVLMSSDSPKKAMDFYAANYSYLDIREGKVVPRFKAKLLVIWSAALLIYIGLATTGLMIMLAGLKKLSQLDLSMAESLNSLIIYALVLGIGAGLTYLGYLILKFGINAPSRASCRSALGELFEG